MCANSDKCRRQRLLELSRATRDRSRQLREFTVSLSRLHLSPSERASLHVNNLTRAAELSIRRGDLAVAKQLLLRGYRIATNHAISHEAAQASQLRSNIERINNNARGFRIWSERLAFWRRQEQRAELVAATYRNLYRQYVLGGETGSLRATCSDYVCQDMRHIILPYQYCSRRCYDSAITSLDRLEIHQSQSIYLRQEVQWLRFRIQCSLQQYQEARYTLGEMSTQIMRMPRMKECFTLGKAYLELLGLLYGDLQAMPAFSGRLTTFMNSFHVLQAERSGLYMAVLVFEIIRLILEQKYELAHRRLAALRVRLQRCPDALDTTELHQFLKVLGYILATIHKCQRRFPKELYHELQATPKTTLYILQGIAPYPELAYRMLRALRYR